MKMRQSIDRDYEKKIKDVQEEAETKRKIYDQEY
jgi:hypothetical protein